MKAEKLLGSALIVLTLLLLPVPTAWGATGLSVNTLFLGEPDVFVPGVGLGVELAFTRSLGVVAEGAYFLSGSWDLALGVSWHPARQFGLYVQTLLLFDVIDGFIPQLGVGTRWSFMLSRSLSFFNGLSVSVPLQPRFLQPTYVTGISLRF